MGAYEAYGDKNEPNLRLLCLLVERRKLHINYLNTEQINKN